MSTTVKIQSKASTLREKKAYLTKEGNGYHRWGGALYEVQDGKYRQMYAENNPASGWRKL